MAFSFVAALTALIPAVRRSAEETTVDDKAHPRFIAGYDAGLKDGRRQIEALTRSRQLLIDHIEIIERSLDRERALSGHWHGEAMRLRDRPTPLGGQHMAENALAQQSQQMMHQMAQQLAMQNWPHCDCSPSRSQALLNRRT